MQHQVTPELRRNPDDKMLFGVGSGLADYFGIDVALTRVILVVTAFLTGGAVVLAYILLAILVPERERVSGPEAPGASREPGHAGDQMPDASGAATPPYGQRRDPHRSPDPLFVYRRRNLAGWLIIGLGAIILAANLGWFRWWDLGKLWPLLLITFGFVLVLGVFSRRD